MHKSRKEKAKRLRNAGRSAGRLQDDGKGEYAITTVKPALNMSLKEEIFEKRMTFASTATAGAGTGVISPAAISNAQVQSLPATEWVSYANRFKLYRVKKIKYNAFPVSTNTSQFAGANVSSCLFACDWAVSAPSTASEILAEERCTLHPTVGRQAVVKTITFEKNPNAKLWTDTGSAIVADRQFGIALCSHPTIIITQPATATLIFAVVIEWIVEFKNMR
jgi:hypothetical protein